MTAGALILALAAVAAVLHTGAVAGGRVLEDAGIRQLATRIIEQNNFDLDVNMLVAIAYIESSFNPEALRVEPHINDASAGLMQTLITTAQWLARDMGYRNYGFPELSDLMDAEVSMYFGAAYLDYLKNTRRDLDTEEKIVRGYNGGPAGFKRSATLPYWQKYKRAREKFS